MSAKKTNPLKIAPALLPLAVPIEHLKADPANVNEHSDESISAIKASLEKYGQLKAIVICGDVVKAGNGTLAAAKLMHATHIAAVPIPKEFEKFADEFALSDNQTARLSKWNPDALKRTLKAMKLRGVQIHRLGFRERDLKAMLAKVKPAALEAVGRKTKPSTLVHTCPECGHEFSNKGKL